MLQLHSEGNAFISILNGVKLNVGFELIHCQGESQPSQCASLCDEMKRNQCASLCDEMKRNADLIGTVSF